MFLFFKFLTFYMIGMFAKFMYNIDKQLKGSCDCYKFINSDDKNQTDSFVLKNNKGLFKLKNLFKDFKKNS